MTAPSPYLDLTAGWRVRLAPPPRPGGMWAGDAWWQPDFSTVDEAMDGEQLVYRAFGREQEEVLIRLCRFMRRDPTRPLRPGERFVEVPQAKPCAAA